MKKLILLFSALWLTLTSCSSVKIVDKPIIFDQERTDLTLEYLNDHYGLVQEEPTILPKMVVVHWTAISTFEKSFDAFYNSKLPNWRPDLKNASALNVSSQFLIDQDGTIYRLMPETIMARHVIGLNHSAIGIENVGGTENTPLTDAQLEANIKLIKYLKKKYPEIEYVIGHFEYPNFDGTELWLEKDAGYRTKKTDPGKEFIEKIRQETSKYNWKPVPEKK
jgi:N-acetyl-anhydromuramyl-L-alanine amidase AmpD